MVSPAAPVAPPTHLHAAELASIEPQRCLVFSPLGGIRAACVNVSYDHKMTVDIKKDQAWISDVRDIALQSEHSGARDRRIVTSTRLTCVT